ncbi:MAG TPA: hypothetical protein VEF76_09490 [Patescibacteria group bacterium]|nr:hypothetical protein [Patescibacteria group bacterium]
MADDAPASDFAKAARQPGSPKFIFENAVAEFYEAYPERLGNVFFVDVSTGNIAHPDEKVVGELIELIGSEQGKEVLQPIIAHCRKQKTSYCQVDEQGNSIIFIYTGDDRPRFFDGAVTPAQELQFIFDHETGHALVPEGGSRDRLVAENAADAFALIRNLQRNGPDPELAEQLMLFRTRHALYNTSGMINFSGPTVEKVNDAQPRLAAAGVNPQQAISLAGAFAAHYTPNNGEAQHLFESFEKLHGQTPLGELTNIVLTTPFPDTFKWTSTVLKAILEKKIAPPDGLAEEFNEDAAKTLPPKIAARAAALADYDFIGEVLRDKPMPKGTPPFLNGHPKA